MSNKESHMRAECAADQWAADIWRALGCQRKASRILAGNMKKLQYLGKYKLGILIVMIFAIASTIFSYSRAKDFR